MSTLHTVASIKNIMSSYRIGTVERVDFTPINKKPGFGENVDEIVMSAFVHFSDPLLGYDNCYNYMSDSYLGNNDFWDDTILIVVLLLWLNDFLCVLLILL
jgi:hypothetical protein